MRNHHLDTNTLSERQTIFLIPSKFPIEPSGICIEISTMVTWQYIAGFYIKVQFEQGLIKLSQELLASSVSNYKAGTDAY